MADKVQIETFVLSHAEGHIVYSPLRGALAYVNGPAVEVIKRALHGRHALSEDETAFLGQSGLGRTFIESPALSLSVPEDEAFCPTCVSLYLTDACNLACIYCYAHGGRNRIPCEIPLDAARAAIGFVAENASTKGEHGFVVSFHGAGEPTQAWGLLQELTAYAREKGKALSLSASVATCTNGVISESQARWLAANTDTATVSIDGLERHHNLNRPHKRADENSFRRVVGTLKTFDHLGFPYSIQTTVTEQTVADLPEIVDFFVSEFQVMNIQIDPVLITGRCHETSVKDPAMTTFVESFIGAAAIGRRAGRNITTSIITPTSLRTYYCCAVSQGFTVTHNGDVTACFESYGGAQPFPEIFVYGRYNSQEKRFELDLAKQSLLRKRHVHRLDACRDCFNKYMCCGDCPMHAMRVGGSLAPTTTGDRCAMLRTIGKAELVARFFPGIYVGPVAEGEFLSGSRNDAIDSWQGNTLGQPEVFALARLSVRESPYMKVPETTELQEYFLSRGNGAYCTGDFCKAEEMFKHLLTTAPTHSVALNNLALTYQKMGRFEDALDTIQYALSCLPNSAVHLGTKGSILARMSRLEEALACLDQAIEYDPHNTVLLRNRKRICFALGKADSNSHSGVGDREYTLGWDTHLVHSLNTGGLETMPAPAMAMLERGLKACATGRYDDALAASEQAAGKAPNLSLPLWLKAKVLWHMGEYDASSQSLSDAQARMGIVNFADAENAGIFIEGQFFRAEGDMPLLPGRYQWQKSPDSCGPTGSFVLGDGERWHCATTGITKLQSVEAGLNYGG